MNTSRSNVLRLPNAGSNGSHDPSRSFPLVLLCDDEPRDLIAMERLLRRHGFSVVATRSVSESERALAEWSFSAVVADLKLGHGKPDGLALLEAAQQAQPAAARVLVTASFDGPQLAELADAVFVDKAPPTMAIELVRVLRTATGASE